MLHLKLRNRFSLTQLCGDNHAVSLFSEQLRLLLLDTMPRPIFWLFLSPSKSKMSSHGHMVLGRLYSHTPFIVQKSHDALANATEWRRWLEKIHVMMYTATGEVSHQLCTVCLMDYDKCVRNLTSYKPTVQLWLQYATTLSRKTYSQLQFLSYKLQMSSCKLQHFGRSRCDLNQKVAASLIGTPVTDVNFKVCYVFLFAQKTCVM